MKLKNITILKSSQSLLIEEFINNLRDNIYKNSLYSVYQYSDISINNIFDEANSLSMFSDNKLIVVRNFNYKSKKDLDKIIIYSENPSKTSNIIFITNSSSNNPKIKSSNNISVIDLDIKNNINTKISEQAKQLGLKLNSKAINALKDNLGEDLNLIKNELLKISSYFDTKNEIDEKDIYNLIDKTNFNDAFSLINALSNRQLKNSLKILKELEKSQEDPLSILHLISHRFRQILIFLEYKRNNLKNEEIAKKLKTSKGAVYYIEKSSKNFKLTQLKDIFRILKEADYRLKNSVSEKYITINRVLVDICKS